MNFDVSKLKVVATGGYSSLISKDIDKINIIDKKTYPWWNAWNPIRWKRGYNMLGGDIYLAPLAELVMLHLEF